MCGIIAILGASEDETTLRRIIIQMGKVYVHTQPHRPPAL
jgi:hypothetical protein